MADRSRSSDPPKLEVLLIEDDYRVVEAVREGLSARHVVVHHAPTVAEGKRLLGRATPFDAIILDLTLPDGDGTEIAAACRRGGRDVPIIMTTARDSVEDRIAGLGHGADDYLCKPFAVAELAARLNAVLRRSRRARRHVLTYGDARLDLLRRQVRRHDSEVTLSVRELDLLAFMMCHPEEVLSKERILKEIWGDEVEQDVNVLHVYANYLRNKLEQDGHPRIIHTVRGVGYILSETDPAEEPVMDGRPAPAGSFGGGD